MDCRTLEIAVHYTKGSSSMAISSAQVFAAADTIAATGKIPTVITVRSHLGTGSYTTIARILREWTETHVSSTVNGNSTDPVPQQVIDYLLALAPKIWTVATNIANKQLSEERTEMDVERIANQSALADNTAKEKRIVAELDAAHAQIAKQAALIRDKDIVIANQKLKCIELEKTVAVLEATKNQMESRLADLKVHLAYLNELGDKVKTE
jgi:hypothetical protein